MTCKYTAVSLPLLIFSFTHFSARHAVTPSQHLCHCHLSLLHSVGSPPLLPHLGSSALFLKLSQLTQVILSSWTIFNPPTYSETMSNGFRARSSSDPTTPPSVLPALASGRLPDSVERIGEYPLGFGGYSDVWKAMMTKESGAASLVCVSFSLLHDHFSTVLDQVALKVLRTVSSDPDRLRKVSTLAFLAVYDLPCVQCLEREVGCWKLADHENIAAFYGVVYQSNGAPGLVLPWYENGSADKYLRRHPNADPIKTVREPI